MHNQFKFEYQPHKQIFSFIAPWEMLKVFIIFIACPILVNVQSNLYGCLSTFNMDCSCPKQRLFELSYFIGNHADAASSNLGASLIFYDRNSNVIANLPLRFSGCTPYQKGNTDMIKICAAWIEIATSVVFRTTQPDAIQVETMTAASDNSIQIKSKFWLDGILEPIENYIGYPAYTQVQFNL